MASIKVSELELTDDFEDEAYVPVVKGGTTYKMSLEKLLQKTLRTDKTYAVADIAAKSTISNSDLLLLEDSDDSNTKKQCSKTQFLYDVPQVLTGAGAPADTPAKKGMIYIDTETSDVYIAADTTALGNWKQIYSAP